MGPEDVLQKGLRPVDECKRLFVGADTFVVADIETTGFSPKSYAEILEIGAVKIDAKTGKPVDKYQSLVKPMRGVVPENIEAVTGISTAMVRNARYFESVLPEFYDFLGNALFVAHNARFDWFRFLQPYMLRVGRVITNDVVCTCELSKALHPDMGKHNLEALCEHYGSPIRGHHRAYTDALYTAAAAIKMRSEIMTAEPCILKEAGVSRNPSAPGFINTDSIQVGRAKEYEYKDRKLGTAVFFSTSIGDVYYNRTRGVWGIQRLNVARNVDVEALGSRLFAQYGELLLDKKPA